MRCLLYALAGHLVLGVLTPGTAHGQNPVAGRVVYTTAQVSGQKSCSDGSCHTLNPSANQNRILKGADDPGAIGRAVNIITQMAFLKNVMTTTQFVDLAAYLGNPAAGAGSPTAQLSPSTLSFPSTLVGSSAATQSFAINNTGTAALLVSSVSSSNPNFSIVSSCGTVIIGGNCNVSVGFTPSTAGAQSGTITVSHNAALGSSTLAVNGLATAPVVAVPALTVSPSALRFGSVEVAANSGAAFVTLASVGTAPLIISAITLNGLNFTTGTASSNGCTTSASIAVGGSCSLMVQFVPRVVGELTGSLVVSHNAPGSPTVVNLSGTGTPVAAPPTKTMTEYLYAPLNYYFITSRDDDKVLLDKTAGFQRTGSGFSVLAALAPGARAITRFYFDQIALQGKRGSHFYTLLDADKIALTALNPSNAKLPKLPVDEGTDSWAYLPLVPGVGGSCASGQFPVYRLFRNGARFPDDPNHRFTTDVATYNAFVGLGWDGEGVNFCVPSP